MRNKKLINKRNGIIHKDGSSAVLNIALEKEGGGGKKKTVNATRGIRIW